MIAFTSCLLLFSLTAPESALPPPRHGVYVVAHRGAHEGIPENTLAAYRKAIELGADYVEIDVRTTKDGRFVSVHNDSMESYTEGKDSRKVRDLTFDEVRAIDIGSRVGVEWKGAQVPSFEEILDACKGKIGIYLDLKDAEVEPLVDLVKAKGMERDVLWYASSEELAQVSRLCPDCIPMPDPGPEANLEKLLNDARPKVVASVWKFYSKAFVDRCHDAGALVIVDESGPECWEDALAWKSDGIQTDHPEALIAFLKEHVPQAAKP